MSESDKSGSATITSPPSSPTKPITNPYIVGASFTAYRHEPPVPFGYHYSNLERTNQQVLVRSTHLDWCLSHPPRPGSMNTSKARSIKIASDIRTNKNCGAQIVMLEDGLVAKIFDPLFYVYEDRDFMAWEIDVATLADSEYSIEAAAYLELKDNPVQGTIMPVYYGSWSMTVPLDVDGERIMRDVRMVLIEHVPGIPMLELKPDELTTEVRESIMIKVIEAHFDLRYAGVNHGDLAPRNIVISMSPDSYIISRVTLIDFACSTVSRIIYGGLPPGELHNPLFSWSSPTEWCSWGWLPLDWDEASRRLWEIFGDGRSGKYRKVNRDQRSSSWRPTTPEIMSAF